MPSPVLDNERLRDEPLSAQMGITPAEIQRRLRYVGFTSDDVSRVLALRDNILPHVDELASAFFEHLASLEEADTLMRDPALVNAVRRLKTDHLRAMVSGVYGLDYAEQRLVLGALYARVGLDPRVFLGAFHRLIEAVGVRVMKQYAGEPLAGFDKFMAFRKVAFFDLSLIVDTIVFQRERTIADLQEVALRELSTPVLQVRDRLLIVPIIGTVDSRRAKQLTESLLQAVHVRRAKAVVLDITGVAVVDTRVANHLVETVRAARLMGATTILTGVSTEVAQALAGLNTDFGAQPFAGDLQEGLEHAERLIAASSDVPAGAGSRPESKPFEQPRSISAGLVTADGRR